MSPHRVAMTEQHCSAKASRWGNRCPVEFSVMMVMLLFALFDAGATGSHVATEYLIGD